MMTWVCDEERKRIKRQNIVMVNIKNNDFFWKLKYKL